MSIDDELHVTLPQDGVAVVTLNRPRARNALSSALLRQFASEMRRLQDETEVGAIVLTGNGPVFCAGLDVKELERDRKGLLDCAAEIKLHDVITTSTKPVIAAVNGGAVTGGFEMALCCDIILASSNAFFQDTHARLGLMPGWGLSQRLSRQIGLTRAKEMSLACMPVGAHQAERWGLVNHVLAPHKLMEAAIATAAEIAKSTRRSIADHKTLIDAGYCTTLQDGLRLERESDLMQRHRLSQA